MSTHTVDVVRVYPKPHPNADKLEIVEILGFTCCVQKGQFKDGDLAIYVQPDSMVDMSRKEFAFLNTGVGSDGGSLHRIKVKKLRGVVSMGLVLPVLKEYGDVKEGDDLAELLGITHYNPPEPYAWASTKGGQAGPAPKGYHPTYDVENLRRYNNVLVEGEEVWVSEKIHGCNARFLFQDDIMYCGSKTEWKRKDDKNLWWRALEQNQWIAHYCCQHPGVTVYGEVFGPVQSLRYGCSNRQLKVAVFDILDNTGRWLSVDELLQLQLKGEIDLVPILYRGPFSMDLANQLSEGDSAIIAADCIREGCVIKPVIERSDPEIGRVILKLVSNTFLEKY